MVSSPSSSDSAIWARPPRQMWRTENSRKRTDYHLSKQKWKTNKRCFKLPTTDMKWFLAVRVSSDQSKKPGRVFHVGTISCAPLCFEAKTFLSSDWRQCRQIISSATPAQQFSLGLKVSLQIISSPRPGTATTEIPQQPWSSLAEGRTNLRAIEVLALYRITTQRRFLTFFFSESIYLPQKSQTCS